MIRAWFLLLILIGISEGNSTNEEPSTVPSALSGDPSGAESRMSADPRSSVSSLMTPNEILTELRETVKTGHPHHSEECEPNESELLFKRLMNLRNGTIRRDILDELKSGIKKTCDWKRYMTCDPMSRLCACYVGAIWLPHKQQPTNVTAGMTYGRCNLLLNSTCTPSVNASKNDPNNPLGINPPHVSCIGEEDNVTSCLNGKCTCINPGSKECEDVDHILQTQIKGIMDELREFKWAGLNDSCDLGSPLTIDTTIHTLRHLKIRVQEWRKDPTALQQFCDFPLGLQCILEEEDGVGQSSGRCACGEGYTWYNGTCRGEHGSLCQSRFAGEGNSVRDEDRNPCMPELTCRHLRFLGTQTTMEACCYNGLFGYRHREEDPEGNTLCSRGFKGGAFDWLLLILTFLLYKSPSLA